MCKGRSIDQWYFLRVMTGVFLHLKRWGTTKFFPGGLLLPALKFLLLPLFVVNVVYFCGA